MSNHDKTGLNSLVASQGDDNIDEHTTEKTKRLKSTAAYQVLNPVWLLPAQSFQVNCIQLEAMGVADILARKAFRLYLTALATARAVKLLMCQLQWLLVVRCCEPFDPANRPMVTVPPEGGKFTYESFLIAGTLVHGKSRQGSVGNTLPRGVIRRDLEGGAWRVEGGGWKVGAEEERVGR